MSVVVKDALFADAFVAEIGAGLAERAQADGLFDNAVLRGADQGKLPELRVAGVWAWCAVNFGIVGSSGETSGHAEAKA